MGVFREAELEVDNEVFIGPPPPAMVIEAESSNEAERFEEVSRSLSLSSEPWFKIEYYCIRGVPQTMSHLHYNGLPIVPRKNTCQKLIFCAIIVHPLKALRICPPVPCSFSWYYPITM